MEELLAIVEVDQEKRVKCCGPDCKAYVYKRIHVVKTDDGVKVLGSTCYRGLFGNKKEYPKYTGGFARTLTEEERNLLAENTQKLIDKFENEKVELSKSHPLPTTPQIISSELGREVKCHYCGSSMRTTKFSAPAMGFKCEACVAVKAKLPERPQRWRK